MKRLVALLAVTVLLAGCTGGSPAVSPGNGQTTTDTTATDSDDRPTSSTTCTEITQTTVEPIRESISPASFPDRPEQLTTESVEEFVRAYERVYKRNAVLMENTRDVGVSVSVQSVQSVTGGYLVTVDGVYYYNAADVVTRGTATVIHADGPQYTARYFVSDDRLQRAQARRYDATPADPRSSGTTLECW